MKKVRIMLMCICLVAVAGGVLAFKAMTPGNFCTTATVPDGQGGSTCQNLLCPTYVSLTTIENPNGTVCGTTARFDDEEETYVCTEEDGTALPCALPKAIIGL